MTTAYFPTSPKSIGYDRETRDYMASYDGNVIGFFPNYSAAEEALNDYVLGLIEQGLIDLPLDADSDPFGDPRTDEEKQWDTEGWAECEGGREKFGPHPFDATRTVRHFRPRLFTPEIATLIPEGTDEDDFSDVGPERSTRAVNLNDAPADPVGGDGCGLIVAGAATVTAVVLAALLRS